MATEKIFETPDLYLSSAIVILLKTEPYYKVLNGKTFFCFPANSALYEAMSCYNSGMAINAIQFSGVIKRLRGEAITRRTGGWE
jgi:hypothetical protein